MDVKFLFSNTIKRWALREFEKNADFNQIRLNSLHLTVRPIDIGEG